MVASSAQGGGDPGTGRRTCSDTAGRVGRKFQDSKVDFVGTSDPTAAAAAAAALALAAPELLAVPPPLHLEAKLPGTCERSPPPSTGAGQPVAVTKSGFPM